MRGTSLLLLKLARDGYKACGWRDALGAGWDDPSEHRLIIELDGWSCLPKPLHEQDHVAQSGTSSYQRDGDVGVQTKLGRHRRARARRWLSMVANRAA
jgi:hypothetical protein